MRSLRGGTKLAVVVSGWPRISETFALNELLALKSAGMLAGVFATKPGDRSLCQPGWETIRPLVEVLPDDGVASQGATVASRLRGRGVTGVHGYFAHQPAAVAAVAAVALDVPYGFSVHALDVRKVGAAELRERAAGAAVVVSCNADAAARVRAAGTEPCLLAHGVDLNRFSAVPPPDGPVPSLLAVGRLVEKKGFDVLVEALRLLRQPFRLDLVGDGPERPRLERAIADHGLADRVRLLGRRTHAELPALYAAADLVVVPSVVTAGGDRDGLPNVVLEAMASGRPVVASDVGAIASAVRPRTTGLLVPPEDPVALCRALTELVDCAALRHRLGAAGRADAESRFGLERCGRQLCEALERSYA